MKQIQRIWIAARIEIQWGLHTVGTEGGGVPDQTRSALPFGNLAEAVQEDRPPRADRIPTPRPIRCNVYAVLKLGQRFL